MRAENTALRERVANVVGPIAAFEATECRDNSSRCFSTSPFVAESFRVMAMAIGASPLLYALSVESTASPCCSYSCAPQVWSSSLVKLVPSGRVWHACGASRGARAMAPEDEKMTRRSPLDFPIEWDRPRPGRRADIFPQFSPMKTPLPPPLPADPPEEDEEEEEKKEGEEEENPDEPEKPDVSF